MALAEDWEAPRALPRNLTDKAGALLLKQTVEDVWKRRGHNVQVWIEPAGFTMSLRGARYDVRSDLVNGLPRKKPS